MANPIVSSLPAYVQTNASEILYKSAFGAKTVKNIRIQPGVHGKGALNVITPSITWNASGCGFTDSSSAALSQREINTALMVVNATLCEDQLRGIYAEQLLNARGELSDDQFIDNFVNSYVAAQNKALDTVIWQGSTTNGDPFNGFLTGITADGVAKDAATAITSASTPAQIYTAVMNMIALFPTEALEDGKGVIFMGEDVYNKFVIGLVNQNLYHYGVDRVEDGIVIPGTTVKAIGVHGLNGAYKMVGGSKDNFVFGTDFEGSNEAFDFWYSKDNQEYRLVIKYSAGVNTVFPDQIVIND